MAEEERRRLKQERAEDMRRQREAAAAEKAARVARLPGGGGGVGGGPLVEGGVECRFLLDLFSLLFPTNDVQRRCMGFAVALGAGRRTKSMIPVATERIF